MATTNYFKRFWDETTGDGLTDAWGTSTHYFETDDHLNVTRQMQVFENGRILKYDEDYVDDEFGGLADQQLDVDDMSEYRIDKDEFEEVWKNSDTPKAYLFS